MSDHDALVEIVADEIRATDHNGWPDNSPSLTRIATAVVDALDLPARDRRTEQALMDRLIAKAAQDGIVFVSDGHFGRAKRIQDWLREQRPVEGGE